MQSKPKTNWLKVGLLVISSLASLISMITAAGAIASGIAILRGNAGTANLSVTPFSVGVLFAFLALVHARTFIQALGKRRAQTESAEPKAKRSLQSAHWLMGSWPLLMLAGYFASISSLDWLVLPFINLAVVVIPIWWLADFGRRGLANQSKKRNWGVLSISLSITPLVIILVEVIVMLIAFIALFSILSLQPQWMQHFNQIAQSFYRGEINYARIEEFLLRLLQEPTTATFLLITVAVVLPTLEEFFKPMAMWSLIGRKPSPAEGFSLGILCGAAFALLESAGVISQFTGGDWAVMVLLRSSTGLLHMSLSGLVGWGLASAWSQKNYKRMVFALISSAGLHGLWNGLALTIGYSPTVFSATPQEFVPTAGNIAAITIMALEFLGLFWLLVRMNHKLVKEEAQQTSQEIEQLIREYNEDEQP